MEAEPRLHSLPPACYSKIKSHISDLTSFIQQIVDFLNVSDEPVLGYAPPMSVTTLHLHLWSCSLDYRYLYLIILYVCSLSLCCNMRPVLDRPLYLPLRSLLLVETFSISSSVSLDHSSSTLRYEPASVLSRWRKVVFADFKCLCVQDHFGRSRSVPLRQKQRRLCQSGTW